ncbi:MAG: NAD(P)-dependent oxidoreductase, partial [Nitrospirae bacterium]
MDILLTGATGFIGSHLRKALSVTHQVSAITRGACKEERGRVIWISADLEQANFTDSLPEKLDAVLVMAQAREYRDFPEQVWPIFNVNIRSLIALLEYARCHGAKKFIFASSANVYQRST